MITFLGANTCTGSTTLCAGTLLFGNNSPNGSIATTCNIVNNGHFCFYRSDGPHTYSMPITGTGVVSKNGNVAQILSNTSNAWRGATTVTEGTLTLGAIGVIQSGNLV